LAAIPELVFQHFRNPQNKGALKEANGQGEVDGRAKNSKLTFFLLVDDQETILKAAFTTLRDRASDAPLSMITGHVMGRTLAEVETLAIEEVGQVFGLAGETLPMLIPAFEALHAAIANYKGLPNPFAFEGGMVCTCLSVREGRLRRAIRERSLKTFKEVQTWTRACTGCRSCRPEVQRILSEELDV
jgi:NifU-like protein involved in Fe-S cluster formation/bacterioferritin-associated ferredoxin